MRSVLSRFGNSWHPSSQTPPSCYDIIGHSYSKWGGSEINFYSTDYKFGEDYTCDHWCIAPRPPFTVGTTVRYSANWDDWDSKDTLIEDGRWIFCFWKDGWLSVEKAKGLKDHPDFSRYHEPPPFTFKPSFRVKAARATNQTSDYTSHPRAPP